MCVRMNGNYISESARKMNVLKQFVCSFIYFEVCHIPVANVCVLQSAWMQNWTLVYFVFDHVIKQVGYTYLLCALHNFCRCYSFFGVRRHL